MLVYSEMSKFKNLITKIVKTYIDNIQKVYDDRYYRYSHNLY